VETAGWSWREGHDAGDRIADSLAGKLAAAERHLSVTAADPAIRLALPQRLALPNAGTAMSHFQLRLNEARHGLLELRDAEQVLWCGSVDSLPERRVLVPLSGIAETARGDRLTLAFTET
jgi:hypothetical protein